MFVFYIVPFIIVFYLLIKKKKFSKKHPIPLKNIAILLDERVEFYRILPPNKKKIFEKLVDDFLVSTKIEAVGTELTDLDKVLVAASAIIPVFGFPGWRYKNLTDVILYPDNFNQDFQFEAGNERQILGMVGTGFLNGQMILSKVALEKGFSKEAGKSNTAIHEFVHLLDKADGTTDGIPEILMHHQPAIPWLKMIHQEMNRIQKGRSDINPYALTNEAEFLAVASEYFFEKPNEFKHHHPELYQMMSEFFRQDLV
ncbi:MAG: zinc-dependent peptidase [Sphingobacteriales bacterium]|nr:zinc-dependent peptidase [Sphingobacteriales bacterium]